MHKKFYCKMCKAKTIFVRHETEKQKFICSNCRFTTSNPQEEIKIRKEHWFSYI